MELKLIFFIVNQMTHDEKAKLKLEVENCTPKEASELLAMHQSKEDDKTKISLYIYDL